jgi:hypothetical protein
MQGDLLSAADPNWLARVLRGQLYIVIGCVLPLAGIPLIMALDTAFDDFLDARPFFREIANSVPWFLSLAFVLVGAVSVTSLDPRLSLTEQPIGLRRIVRSAAITALGIMLLRDALRIGDFGGAAVAVIPRVLWWAFRVTLAIVVFSLTYYVARLAERIPDPRLTQRARSTAKKFALFALLAALGIIPRAIATAAGYDTRSLADGGPIFWSYFKVFGFLFGFVACAYGVDAAWVWWRFRRAFKGCLIEARDRATGESAGEQP